MAELADAGLRGLQVLWLPMLDHLWQATLFAGLIFLSLSPLRRAPARLRHALCLLASLKFLVPSALVVGVLARLEPQATAFAGVLERLLERVLAVLLPAADGSGATLPEVWVAVLSLAWLAGATFLLGGWLGRHRSFARVVARGHPLTAGREAAAFDRARRRLGLFRPVGLVASGEIAEPAVWGVRQPVLVLPEGVAGHLTDDELEAVLLHELVHVRRRDNLTATLHRVLCCLFWFHPMLWLLDRRLLAERERLCDDRVVALCGRSEVYARSLLKVLRAGLGWRLAGVSAATASNLKRRIERLHRGAEARRPQRLAQAAGLACGVAFFFVFSLLAAEPPCRPRQIEWRLLTVEVQKRFCLKAAAEAPPPAAAVACPERG